ncbi:MAG: hypothetical protein AAB583_02830 [Patescibacteria group bacterium]
MIFRFGKRKNNITKTITDYKREALVRIGREQFKKLLEKGINLPIALL